MMSGSTLQRSAAVSWDFFGYCHLVTRRDNSNTGVNLSVIHKTDRNSSVKEQWIRNRENLGSNPSHGCGPRTLTIILASVATTGCTLRTPIKKDDQTHK